MKISFEEKLQIPCRNIFFWMFQTHYRLLRISQFWRKKKLNSDITAWVNDVAQDHDVAIATIKRWFYGIDPWNLVGTITHCKHISCCNIKALWPIVTEWQRFSAYFWDAPRMSIEIKKLAWQTVCHHLMYATQLKTRLCVIINACPKYSSVVTVVNVAKQLSKLKVSSCTHFSF